MQEAPIAARLRDLGASPRITTPAETLEFIRAEKADFGTIARAGKSRAELHEIEKELRGAGSEAFLP